MCLLMFSPQPNCSPKLGRYIIEILLFFFPHFVQYLYFLLLLHLTPKRLKLDVKVEQYNLQYQRWKKKSVCLGFTSSLTHLSKNASSGINVYLCEEPKGYILIDYFIDKEHFNKDSLPCIVKKLWDLYTERQNQDFYKRGSKFEEKLIEKGSTSIIYT